MDGAVRQAGGERLITLSVWSVVEEAWEEVFENWGFVSNFATEIIAIILVVIAGSYLVPRWIRHQLRGPSDLAFGRMRASTMRILRQATIAIGYKSPDEVAAWTVDSALEKLLPFLDPDEGAKAIRAKVSDDDWLVLGRFVVTEFEALRQRIESYAFVFQQKKEVFDAYSFFDTQVDRVRAVLEILDNSTNHAPGLVVVARDGLSKRVAASLVATGSLLIKIGDVNVTHAVADAEALRDLGQYSKYMEKRLREYSQAETAQKRGILTLPRRLLAWLIK